MCRTGCPTQDHRTWGECFRAAGVEWGNPGQRSDSKAWDSELAEYASARRQGLNPPTTQRKDIRETVKLADKGIMV